MKIFITGATGFVGSRVLTQLLAQGNHQTCALVRSNAAAEQMRAKGVEATQGGLEDLDVASTAAKQADVVLHLAFNHDMSRYTESMNIDAAFSTAIVAALAGSGKTFIATSGSPTAGDSGDGLLAKRPAGEFLRGKGETAELKGSEQDIRAFVLRLPLYVYDDTPYTSFLSDIQVQAAKKAGYASYIASGTNKFSALHVEDAASAYVAAATTPTAPPGIYHIAGEQGLTGLQLGTAISKKLSLPLKSVSTEEAQAMYKALAGRFSMNSNVSIAKRSRD